MKTNRTLIITGTITLVVGILFGWWIGGSDSASKQMHDHSMEAGQTEVWTCSMHPQIRQPEPGQCPLCGMDLIPASAESSEADSMSVKMSEAAMKLADVQTTVVGYGGIAKPIRLNGKVQPNERLLRSQASHVAGRIEQLFVDFTGEYIKEGTPLATIYSPELVTAQKALIIAAKVKIEQPGLYTSTKAKLKNWKLTDAQIDALEHAEEANGTVSILSNTNGYVLERKVQRGNYVKKGESLYEVVDLSSVWLLFDVYESDLQWVDKADRIQITVSAIPTEQWASTVSYVDPVIDPKTRVAKARVELANPGNRLKPEMFATGIIETRPSASKEETLTIPKSAVMWTGKRSVVYIKTQDENGVYFRMREVELGPELGKNYAILSGLQPGEEIVTNGTFSIDAAAQLAGKPSMMSPEGGPAPKGHDHGNHSPTSSNHSEPATKPRNDKHNHSSEATQENTVPAEFNDMLDSYFKLKTALTKSDMTNAEKYAKTMNQQLQAIEMGAFRGDSHTSWMELGDSLKSASRGQMEAKDIQSLRDAFKRFSSQLIELAETMEGYDQPVYVQFCPMADHNKGAHWLSRQETIINPYFGRNMLSCGSTQKTIL